MENSQYSLHLLSKSVNNSNESRFEIRWLTLGPIKLFMFTNLLYKITQTYINAHTHTHIILTAFPRWLWLVWCPYISFFICSKSVQCPPAQDKWKLFTSRWHRPIRCPLCLVPSLSIIIQCLHQHHLYIPRVQPTSKYTSYEQKPKVK